MENIKIFEEIVGNKQRRWNSYKLAAFLGPSL